MIEIYNQRRWLTDISTIGELSIDGVFECLVLEDKVRPYPEKVLKETAIWEGVYELQWTLSQRFGFYTLQVMDVPLFTGIRIHAGNDRNDTEGCLLTGISRGVDIVRGSRIALALFEGKIVPFIKAGTKARITIANPVQQLNPLNQ